MGRSGDGKRNNLLGWPNGLAQGVAPHLCNIDLSIVPWFEPFSVPSVEPKTDELKDFSCWF